MNIDAEVIWRRGDTEMPKNVRHVVKAAQNELLLRSLQLPVDAVDAVDVVRYNASKSNKTIRSYVHRRQHRICATVLCQLRRCFTRLAQRQARKCQRKVAQKWRTNAVLNPMNIASK